MDRRHKISGLMLTPLMKANGVSIMNIQIGQTRTKQKTQVNMEMSLLWKLVLRTNQMDHGNNFSPIKQRTRPDKFVWNDFNQVFANVLTVIGTMEPSVFYLAVTFVQKTKLVTKRIKNASIKLIHVIYAPPMKSVTKAKSAFSIAKHVLPWIRFATETKMVVFQLVHVAIVLKDGVVMKQLRLVLIHVKLMEIFSSTNGALENLSLKLRLVAE